MSVPSRLTPSDLKGDAMGEREAHLDALENQRKQMTADVRERGQRGLGMGNRS